MERKKWWASLIAVAVGLAFSVGSALAYEQGDLAEGNGANSGKLIPYYMAGDNLATIIGVNNQATADADGDTALAAGTVSIIEVRVLNEMGAVQAMGELCLAPNQFGYAVLKEEMMMMDDMDMMDDMQVVLMLGVGDTTAMVTGMTDQMTTGVSGRAGSDVNMTSMGSGIASMGYVVLSELGTFTMEDPDNPADPPIDTDDGCDSQGTPLVAAAGDAGSVGARFAAWTILQDIGEGSFFGTEIPTVTVATNEDIAATDADMDRIESGTDGCDTDGYCRGLVELADTGTTVTVRFDNDMENMSESMVYVWMDTNTGFMGSTGTRAPREAVAMVYCEGAAAPNRVELDLPDRVNMVYGSMLGCDARGVAMITLPNAGTAGTDPGVAAVWSHISQEGGGFRMNFAGFEDL